MNQLSIGTDPEVLVRNRRTREIVSAIDLIKEGKENPRDLGKGFKVLHDNVLVEFNVPPSVTPRQFINNLREGLNRITKVIGKDFELLPQASHNFDPKFFKHEDARVFGCQPEFDAYEMRMCNPPDANTNLRSCGSHIHLGRMDYKNPSDEVLMNPYSKNRIIQLMDLFVGIPLTIIDKDKTSSDRKQLYGRAGRLRPTPYGVEYRTPPNYWLRSPELAALVFDLSKHAVSIENTGRGEQIISTIDLTQVQMAINTSNKRLCSKLMKQLPFPAILRTRISNFNRQLPNSLKAWKI